MPVILHIGMQKTGTSALQYFFHHNQERLAQDGIVYPHIAEFQEIDFSGVSYHNSIAGALGGIRSSFPAMSPNGLASLRRFLETSSDRVLLSAEDFSRSLDLSHIREFFAGIPTTVVVYLREQSAWAQSMYNQRNKLLFTRANERLFSNETLTAQDLFKFLNVERYAGLMRYDNLLGRWADAFGRANLIVRTFPVHDLLADFMSALGVADLSGYNPPPRINENLSNAWVSLVCEIAIERGVEEAKATVSKLTEYASNGRINLAGETDFLPPHIVNKIRSDYSEANQRVAREYLGRDDLFPS